MLHKTFLASVIIGLSLLAASFATAQDTTSTQSPEGTEMTTSVKTGYASVNGLEMYYEIHGEGEPLVLLHGGLATINLMAGPLLAGLANRQVIAFELQGHGHTADIDRPLSYEQMADDVTAAIMQLGYDSVDVMGYSLGGGVALQMAIRHPEVVRKLILVSTAFRNTGWYPEVTAAMTSMDQVPPETMSTGPLYDAYTSVAPQPDNWIPLTHKVSQMLKTDYDWSADVAALKMPVLIVVGDGDSIQMTHAVEMFGLLGGGKADGSMGGVPNAQFAVLPNTLHWNILFRADLLLPIVTPFLDAPLP